MILELMLATTLISQSAQSNNLAFQSELKTLVVFKEGFGFYIREGSAVLEDGWATTNLVPRAASGTYWVYPLNPANSPNSRNVVEWTVKVPAGQKAVIEYRYEAFASVGR